MPHRKRKPQKNQNSGRVSVLFRAAGRLYMLLLAALFAALSAVLSQVNIPMVPVPMVLTQVSVFLAGGLLGWKWGTLSQAVYVALGAAGLPVFAGFRGGFGALLGPTGGFLLGYLLAAFLLGLLLEHFGRRYRVLLPVLLLAMAAVYLPGVPWLMHVTQTSLRGALAAGVLPFLPGDLLKAALCALLIPRLHRLMEKRGA